MPGSIIFRSPLRAALAACAAVLLAVPGAMAAVPVQSDDIAELSLEELANIKVTSVSRREESPADAATSIFVTTGSDVRRPGAQSRHAHRGRTRRRRAHRPGAPTRPARPRQANNRQGCDHSGFRTQRTR
ncbi:hypothetical protein HAV22_15825 [Massilia sp. TW-1]|uniref:TonB-dependent receptor plug domain-containing protein n=1 Tax=Telluria antibiotica TaxID=2717319 RepID=A0ABX0PE07_9BURK|nr:hypothetical protein [Telluria antibiotica]NIA55106.1 hypothetical protein [Telluria antibiotica]